MDCIFCKIVNGDIPSYTIYEDDIVKCFLDIDPLSNGHTLIIPKKHYKDIFDINSETLNHIFDTSKKVMDLLKEKLNCDGFTLIQNNGDVQEVKHFHLHIKPYYNNEIKMNIEEVYSILKPLI